MGRFSQRYQWISPTKCHRIGDFGLISMSKSKEDLGICNFNTLCNIYLRICN